MIELDGIGKLTSPVVIAAFEGWNDAGEAASGVINHLSLAWQAEPVGAIDPEDYYDFQVTRPVIEVAEGRTSAWSGRRPGCSRPSRTPGRPRHVLVHGIEPNMRWRGFCSSWSLSPSSASSWSCCSARCSPTRRIPARCRSGRRGRRPGAGRRPRRRAGATTRGRPGSSACCSTRAREAGIPAVSLWAAVPHYVAQPPSPKATLALIRGVEDVLDVSLPLADLPQEARAWERGVDELAEQDTEVADYVRTLEEAKDATDLPEASGDAIARGVRALPAPAPRPGRPRRPLIGPPRARPRLAA